MPQKKNSDFTRAKHIVVLPMHTISPLVVFILCVCTFTPSQTPHQFLKRI